MEVLDSSNTLLVIYTASPPEENYPSTLKMDAAGFYETCIPIYYSKKKGKVVPVLN
jgi:hypothetical protein